MDKLPVDWRKFHLDNIRSLDHAKVLEAAFLRKEFPPQDMASVKLEADKDPEWWTTHHFLGMMGVRNALRSAGFGETEFGIDNLDDYAVGLVELALGVTTIS